jgi:hypothetical protein
MQIKHILILIFLIKRDLVVLLKPMKCWRRRKMMLQMMITTFVLVVIVATRQTHFGLAATSVENGTMENV